MMEDRVEHHANAPAMQLVTYRGERRVIAEAAVDAEVVGDVVAVRAGFEDRPEQQRVDAEILEIIDPAQQG